MNISLLLSSFLCYRSSALIRNEYSINTYHITALIGAYIYCKFINDTFTIHKLEPVIRSYSHTRLKTYINRLKDCGLIKLVSNIPYNRYTITQAGEEAIKSIIDNHSVLVFEFCSKYNIVL